MNTDSQNHYNYCALPLALYACRPDLSRGRVFGEAESRHRTNFQRDRDRVIHSSAFRRLKDKAQVFTSAEGDHFRTRLSHSLEVAQIAKTLSRCLMINEDLAETIALAHDLGHPPFAHMGEDMLKISMQNYGGFAHNDQSLRVLTMLEDRYVHWKGLNLTWETLEGVVKHNGPVLGVDQTPSRDHLPVTLYEISQNQCTGPLDLKLTTYASLEAQVAAIADDIAYNNHDIEDGLRAGLFSLSDIAGLKIVQTALDKIRDEYGGNLHHRYVVFEMIRNVMGQMVDDVLTHTREKLRELNPQSPDDIALAGAQIVEFSPEFLTDVNELRRFLRERMYHHYEIERIRFKVGRMIPQLFDGFMNHPLLLPQRWQAQLIAGENEGGAHPDHYSAYHSDHHRARVICDYIAGMTDRFAVLEYRRIFELSESFFL